MRYTWTKQEILDARQYWIDYDLKMSAHQEMRNKIVGAVYYVLLAGIAISSMFFFAG